MQVVRAQPEIQAVSRLRLVRRCPRGCFVVSETDPDGDAAIAEPAAAGPLAGA
jgi:hypothetical protein